MMKPSVSPLSRSLAVLCAVAALGLLAAPASAAGLGGGAQQNTPRPAPGASGQPVLGGGSQGQPRRIERHDRRHQRRHDRHMDRHEHRHDRRMDRREQRHDRRMDRRHDRRQDRRQDRR